MESLNEPSAAVLAITAPTSPLSEKPSSSATSSGLSVSPNFGHGRRGGRAECGQRLLEFVPGRVDPRHLRKIAPSSGNLEDRARANWNDAPHADSLPQIAFHERHPSGGHLRHRDLDMHDLTAPVRPHAVGQQVALGERLEQAGQKAGRGVRVQHEADADLVGCFVGLGIGGERTGAECLGA
jgi:hypothetical protein